MNILSLAYTEVLFRPLFNLLVAITNVLPGHGIGWAIIGVTVLVRLVLLPSSLRHASKMRTNQDKMQQLKVELDHIKKQHKDNKGKQAEETMRLYKKAGVNPASGCLPLLIQLPILIALYRVFLTDLQPESFHWLYQFVSHPTAINFNFFSLDLHQPSLILGILAGLGQFVQTKWLSPLPQTPAQGDSNDDAAAMMASMQKNMAYIFPVMTVFISLQLPAALALYWVVSTVFGIAQQYILKRTLHLKDNPPAY